MSFPRPCRFYWADLGKSVRPASAFALLRFCHRFVIDYAKIAKRQNLGLTGKRNSRCKFWSAACGDHPAALLATHFRRFQQLVLPFSSGAPGSGHLRAHESTYVAAGISAVSSFVAGNHRQLERRETLHGWARGLAIETVIAAGARRCSPM